MYTPKDVFGSPWVSWIRASNLVAVTDQRDTPDGGNLLVAGRRAVARAGLSPPNTTFQLLGAGAARDDAPQEGLRAP